MIILYEPKEQLMMKHVSSFRVFHIANKIVQHKISNQSYKNSNGLISKNAKILPSLKNGLFTGFW